MKKRIHIILISILIFIGILSQAQTTIGISADGCKFISAEGFPQGKCFSINAEVMYTKYLESNLGLHIRGGVKIMPLEIYSEVLTANMRYTETIYYVALGGVSMLNREHGDELYYHMQLGRSRVSKSLYVAFKIELQGINLSNKKKNVWKYNLNPYVYFGAYRGWKNINSYHLQLSTGLTFKL